MPIDLPSIIDNLGLDFHERLLSLGANVAGGAVGIALYLILSSIPVLGWILAPLGWLLVKIFIQSNPNRELRPNHIGAAINDFRSHRSEKISDFKKVLQEQLQKCLNADDFTKDLPQVIDDSLDIIALKKFKEELE